MRVGLATGPHEFSVTEAEQLPPGPFDVVVEVGASGICASDHSVMTGSMPFPPPIALGHELAGRIVEIGREVTTVRVGDRVIGRRSLRAIGVGGVQGI